jgi:O-antigen ligase
MGLINYLIALNHARLLSLVILVPSAVLLSRNPAATPFGRLLTDKLLAGFLMLIVVMFLRSTSATDTLRQATYVFIDVLLPYYVISRGLRTLPAMREAIFCFLLATLLVTVAGIFEFGRHWLLYRALLDALGLSTEYGGYLGRDGALRASATTGHPIALGTVIAAGIGLFTYLKDELGSPLHRRLAGIALIGGAFASLSRGPWLGTAVMFAVYVATGRAGLRNLAFLVIGCVVAIPLLAVVPGGQKLLNLLPFIGTVETENIYYRERLIDNALIVIGRNPLFGSIDYLKTPEMESMRQGQGIIDIVNTYISVALEYGFIGLALFVGFFLAVLYGVFKAIRALKHVDEEMNRLGRALFATLTGILVIIFTVSSITVIPIVYWSVAALCVAYVQIARSRLKQLQAGEQPAVA